MRIKNVRKLLWIANTVLVLALLYFVVGGFILEAAGQEGPQRESEVLGMSETGGGLPALPDTGPGPMMTYRFTHELPISGFPPTPPEPVAPTEGPAGVVSPLARDYDLLWVKTDPYKVYEYAHVSPKGSETILDIPVGGRVAETGWTLVDARVEDDRGYAEFRHEESGETVTLEEADEPVQPLARGGGTSSAKGDAGGGRTVLGPGYEVPSYEAGPGRDPVEVRPNVYAVPAETQVWTARHFEKIAEDTVIEAVSDRDTGEPIGLLLKSSKVKGGLEKYGVKPGDILISINGVPMKSRSEATAWLKGEGRGLPRYVAIVLRRGAEVTITYDVPPN